MKGSRFSEEQIVGVLKEADAGVPMKGLCRRIGEHHRIDKRRQLRCAGDEFKRGELSGQEVRRCGR